MTWRLYAVFRSAGCWFLLSLNTVLVAIPYSFITLVAPEGRLVRKLERFWVWFILWGSRVRLTVRGLENVEAGQSYVVMANHRSLYDIPVLHYLLGRDRDLRFIGKKELVKVPVFGWIFALSRHVVIDRDNRARAIAALREAASESGEGVSFVIMPEGTRNTASELRPFKKGGFHLAIDTGLPILPIVIVGGDKLMRKGSWHILPGAIHVEVLPPIPVEGLDKRQVESLLERTRAVIEEGYQRATAEVEGSPR
jgi:1-acyl-sn-glycerol-3-phosphate acyltransferase